MIARIRKQDQRCVLSVLTAAAAHCNGSEADICSSRFYNNNNSSAAGPYPHREKRRHRYKMFLGIGLLRVRVWLLLLLWGTVIAGSASSQNPSNPYHLVLLIPAALAFRPVVSSFAVRRQPSTKCDTCVGGAVPRQTLMRQRQGKQLNLIPVQNARPSTTTLEAQMASAILDRSGGLVYRTGVLQPEEFDVIANEVAALAKSSLLEETSSSVAQNRLGLALSLRDSPAVQLLRDSKSSLTTLIQKVAAATTDEVYELAPHIPVEVRSYEKIGACMAWHVDDVLYDPPQIEVVLTLENTSDCQTVWKVNVDDTTDPSSITTTYNSQETDRNSALLLRAGVTPHCVTSLKRGKRIILKCAYVVSGATYLLESNGSSSSHPQFIGGSTKKRTLSTSKKALNRKR